MAHASIYKDAQGACIIIITPAVAPAAWMRTVHLKE